MQLAIILSKQNLLGKLAKFFTGSYAYHCGWVDEEASLLYDMYWLRERRPWPQYPAEDVVLFSFPEITRDYLEKQLTEDISSYGVADYLLFAFRPILQLLRLPYPNLRGRICSEMCNADLWANGVVTPWTAKSPPPSPGDLHNWLLLKEPGRKR